MFENRAIATNRRMQAQSGLARALTTVLAAFALLFAALPALAWPSVFGLEDARPQVPWAYYGDKGPEHWGDLAPEFSACKGERQSPIDLSGGQRLHYSPLSFRYRSTALSVHNDGHSLWVKTPPGSSMIAAGHEYQLTGFRFHAPGEHQINGVPADMELQLEHVDHQGQIAVVAVPMKAGRRMNSTLARIWDHLPGGRGQHFYGHRTGINPRFLLPSDKSYFTYVGSLTEPPCTEGVEWFVLAEPMEVDRTYVQRFLQAVGPNARPVQALNGRPVLAAFRR